MPGVTLSLDARTAAINRIINNRGVLFTVTVINELALDTGARKVQNPDKRVPMPIGIQVKRHLTPRELQVLDLVCQGHSTKQIAGLLSISFKTTACHRMRLMEKAGVHDPINLFRWALLQGHVSLMRPHSPQGADHRSTLE